MFFRQLQYLVALSQEEHFGRAAGRCNVSQPSLSSAIKQLELSLGDAPRGDLDGGEREELALARVDDELPREFVYAALRFLRGSQRKQLKKKPRRCNNCKTQKWTFRNC